METQTKIEPEAKSASKLAKGDLLFHPADGYLPGSTVKHLLEFQQALLHLLFINPNNRFALDAIAMETGVPIPNVSFDSLDDVLAHLDSVPPKRRIARNNDRSVGVAINNGHVEIFPDRLEFTCSTDGWISGSVRVRIPATRTESSSIELSETLVAALEEAAAHGFDADSDDIDLGNIMDQVAEELDRLNTDPETDDLNEDWSEAEYDDESFERDYDDDTMPSAFCFDRNDEEAIWEALKELYT